MKRNSGFTLIELVVVLAILAAIAGLVIPQIDGLRRSSDKGTASHTIGAVSNNTQLFRTLKGSYPERFDSLVDAGTSTLYPKLSPKVSVAMSTTTLTANELKSLTDVGIKNLMYHVDGATSFGQKLPGNTGITETLLTTGTSVVFLDPAAAANSKRTNMIGSCYPDGIPLDSTSNPILKIVIVGVGQNTTSIGQTMQSAPSYQGVDPNKEYNRYMLAFGVYATGKRARLLGAFDSTGDYLTQEVDEFNENTVE